MTVYIADKLPNEAVEGLENLGVDVVYEPLAKAEQLNKGLGDKIVLIPAPRVSGFIPG